MGIWGHSDALGVREGWQGWFNGSGLGPKKGALRNNFWGAFLGRSMRPLKNSTKVGRWKEKRGLINSLEGSYWEPPFFHYIVSASTTHPAKSIICLMDKQQTSEENFKKKQMSPTIL